MNRQMLGVLVIGLALATSHIACKKPGCKDMLTKYIECEGSGDKSKLEKRKEKFLKRCEDDRKDKDVGKITEQMFDCTKKKQCGEFKDCVKGIRKANMDVFKKKWEREELARMAENINKDIDKIKGFATAKDFKKALSRCSWGFTAKRALEKGDDNAKAAAKKYYAFCLTSAPMWLGELAKTGKNEYISICYKDGKSQKELFKNAAATDVQKKALMGACMEMKIGAQMVDAKKNLAKYKDYLPYTCKVKDIDELLAVGTPSAKKMAMDFATFCFVDLGYKIMEKKSKDSYKFCSSMTIKPTLEALKKYNLAKPEHKAVIDIWTAACAGK
ncbi:MAG: hypothetical protein KC609_09940 [Myxococcales bacterium]|nr:hypothetical protein [Myxococcales bacterium]